MQTPKWSEERQLVKIGFVAMIVVSNALFGCSPSEQVINTAPTNEAIPVNDTTTRSETSASETRSSDFLLGGIQVNEADLQAWFDNLRGHSMNTVQVTDYARQGDWDSADLRWGPEGSNDEPQALVSEIRGAKQNGLSVVFVCRIDLDQSFERNAFLWHGMIASKSNEVLAAWFEKYGRFVLQWAEVAEREGVDVFMIGSELNALATTRPASRPPTLEEYFLNPEKQAARRAQVLAEENQIASEHLQRFETVEAYIDARINTERLWAEAMTGGGLESLVPLNARRELLNEHWQALIKKVRRVYSGRVGYAANFDQYQDVGFWPNLDVMGINAYFSLRDRVLADEGEKHLYPLLIEGWRQVLSTASALRRDQGLESMPVIFTEMGFTYRAKSTIRPWAHEGFALIPSSTFLADGSPGPTEEVAVVWADQPERLEERAWAVRALWQVHAELERPFLNGILYWKLSSHAYHRGDEAFMVHIGEGSDDPVLPELRRFASAAPGS